MKTKTSVVITTYNGEKYILQQLRSIAEQSISPDQIIISDDGSTDKTLDIVRDFIENNHLDTWNLIANKGEHGISCNYINALNQTTGDIIFLCDQDDIWDKEKVRYFLEQFRKHPECLCIISAIDYIDKDGKPLKISTSYTCHKDHVISIKELCRVCSYLGMACAIKKELYERTSKTFMRDASHDWALMITASNAGENKVRFAGKVLQHYRMHGSNASVIQDLSVKRKRMQLITRQQDQIRKSCNYHNNSDVINAFLFFLDKRRKIIEDSSVLGFLINIPKYFQLGYSMRNIAADGYAIIKK